MRTPEEMFELILNVAKDVMIALDIEPLIIPVRGGTDGSQLSYMGMPTPNVFTGGENYHGKYEFISVNDMAKSTEVVKGIIQSFEQQA